MKVKELIERLQKLPEDSLVVMSEDAEGNGYSPLSNVEEALYEAETTWYGEAYPLEPEDADDYRPTNAEKAVVLHPIS